ncbi:MAG: ATP-NAD kinase [Amphiamblys sp. WSBS2006]|nr:MAG: ATP-NAD kinase [Amphiamblys sp. WSBS2006]
METKPSEISRKGASSLLKTGGGFSKGKHSVLYRATLVFLAAALFLGVRGQDRMLVEVPRIMNFRGNNSMDKNQDANMPKFLVFNKKTEYCQEETLNEMKTISLFLGLIGDTFVSRDLRERLTANLWVWNDREIENISHSDYRNLNNFLVVLGGDGALLETCYKFQGYIPVIYSFNFGTLGGIVPFSASEAVGVFLGVEGDPKKEYRTRMEVEITRGEQWREDAGAVVCRTVMNEVLVRRDAEKSVMKFGVKIGGKEAGKYAGDGFMVSTPTGSTGYSKSLNGPEIKQDSECFLLSLMCSMDRKASSIIFSDSEEIEISLLPENRCESCHIDFDGRERMAFYKGDVVVVRKSPHSVCMAVKG